MQMLFAKQNILYICFGSDFTSPFYKYSLNNFLIYRKSAGTSAVVVFCVCVIQFSQTLHTLKNHYATRRILSAIL